MATFFFDTLRAISDNLAKLQDDSFPLDPDTPFHSCGICLTDFSPICGGRRGGENNFTSSCNFMLSRLSTHPIGQGISGITGPTHN